MLSVSFLRLRPRCSGPAREFLREAHRARRLERLGRSWAARTGLIAFSKDRPDEAESDSRCPYLREIPGTPRAITGQCDLAHRSARAVGGYRFRPTGKALSTLGNNTYRSTCREDVRDSLPRTAESVENRPPVTSQKTSQRVVFRGKIGDEQLIRNQQVSGSSPLAGSIRLAPPALAHGRPSAASRMP